jgi:hypothetical protein
MEVLVNLQWLEVEGLIVTDFNKNRKNISPDMVRDVKLDHQISSLNDLKASCILKDNINKDLKARYSTLSNEKFYEIAKLFLQQGQPVEIAVENAREFIKLANNENESN